MKERESPIRSESFNIIAREDASQINVLNDPMETDEINTSDSDCENNDSGSEQIFNFLSKRLKK